MDSIVVNFTEGITFNTLKGITEVFRTEEGYKEAIKSGIYVPVKSARCNTNCKWCYGRSWEGKSTKTKRFIPCRKLVKI